MPFQIAREGSLIRITYTGLVTSDDVEAMTAQLLVLEQEISGPSQRLSDFTAVDGTAITASDVRRLSQRRAARRFDAPVKSAFVAPRDAEFGYARMFEMLNGNPSITVRVFRSESDAMAWLREPGGPPNR
jgi:SpoIIAA-like